MRPNYKKIYQDMLKMEYPEKLKDPKIKELLEKLNTSEDVLKSRKYKISRTTLSKWKLMFEEDLDTMKSAGK